MQNQKKSFKKISSKRRREKRTVTKLEDLSTEIFFDIFDYLYGNQIHKSFFGLNEYFNALVYNTPNVHLNLSRTRTRFYRSFHRIFLCENIVSIILPYGNVNVLETMFDSVERSRFQSLSLLDVPLRAFEKNIPGILKIFKDQLVHLKIDFSDMCFTEPGADAARSFGYLLTDLPILRELTLYHINGIDSITYLSPMVTNGTISILSISLRDQKRLIPLLYRFENLKKLHLYKHSPPCMKMARREGIEYYRSLLREKTVIDYPIPSRQINVYGYPMDMDKIETLFQLLITPNLLMLHLFKCQRPLSRHRRPSLQLPLLDGPEWYDLLKKYLSSTLKRFYIEYEDTEDSMSIISKCYIQGKLAKINRMNSSWHVIYAYHQQTKLLSFTFSFTHV